ncbi:pyroglutamyl-peptidase I [Nitratireductor sp. CAU 1489]|uniref:Pyrrolidone-carboxylate peptidase n=1 Tax=Nitratireductor arenosus TaxID=2682096 RepID=A0A844QN33_9HYPH|nr:pyroglutamyl-peptidase I [Nitratireductor arenosus]MVA99271.1 pyroglutamyl-peptidase I [Nitratireductor arenosus]
MGAARDLGPRILVTGFGPFPGAPVNPTEALVADLADAPPRFDIPCALRMAVLDVDYATIATQLSAIGNDFSPDIAIHFGLAAECRGFRLERVARNSHAGARPDRAGGLPASERICAGPPTLSSSLPLDAIAKALGEHDLPVEWSDDAGGYLCNTVFTLSRAGACNGLDPAMSGFVHVPMAGEGTQFRLTPAALRQGACVIVQTCLRHWASGRHAS